MTPVQRALASSVLAFDLDAEMKGIRAELAEGRSRIARTLVKEGPLRLTLIGIAPGGAIQEHVAEGPITIHVLDGTITLNAADQRRTLEPGEVVAVNGGVRHDVSSPNGGMFLLTLVAP